MEAELSPAFSYRQGSVRLVLKDMLACGMAIVLLPDLALRISADKLLSASIRVSFYISGQHLAVPRVTSGGSRRRECLEPIKKSALRRPERCAAPVQPCLSLPEPPPSGGKGETPFPDLSIRRRHLAGRGAGAKRPARSKGAKSQVLRRRKSQSAAKRA